MVLFLAPLAVEAVEEVHDELVVLAFLLEVRLLPGVLLSEGPGLELIEAFELVVEVVAPLGYGVEEAGDLFVGLLHFNELIGDFADKDEETPRHRPLVRPLEGVEAAPRGAQGVRRLQDPSDQVRLVEEVVNDRLLVLLKTVREDVTDTLVENVVERVVLEKEEEAVVEVPINEGPMDVLVAGFVELCQELDQGRPHRTEGQLADTVLCAVGILVLGFLTWHL